MQLNWFFFECASEKDDAAFRSQIARASVPSQLPCSFAFSYSYASFLSHESYSYASSAPTPLPSMPMPLIMLAVHVNVLATRLRLVRPLKLARLLFRT